jgi:hypothetical protein
MEDDFVYQIKIKCDDGIILVIYTNGRMNDEDIILDFMWQQYYDVQPNKSKYTVSNLSKEFDKLIELPKNVFQVHLAVRALEYSEDYN